MTTAQSNIEERVSRLEGGYGHLDTKADMESLRGDLRAEIADLLGVLRGLKWTLGLRPAQWLWAWPCSRW